MELFAWGNSHAELTLAGASAGECSAGPRKMPCTTPAEELPEDFHRIVHVLADRHGHDRAITALAIAKSAKIKPDGTDGSKSRHVRELLEIHFADLPWPVVSDKSGYYRPQDAAELSHYHASLNSRARCIHLRLATLKRLGSIAGFAYEGRCRWTEGGGDEGTT